jgi:pyruvate/2-oxoglutarate dehydrogenase complex dihydrolipoamide dehydrogenase (E3) component
VSDEFDVICIGAGPAGEAIGVELKRSGLSLAVIEKNLVGGECPYWGCMPSKTLLRSAETLAEAERARELAASRVEYTVDYPKVHKRIMWMVRELDDTRAAEAFTKAGHALFRGHGRLTGPRTVVVDDRELTARKAIVIATGTAPRIPMIPGIKGVDVWTNREAILAQELPERMVIIGGGAVGVELGQGFLRLGTNVHMFEAAERVLVGEEPEAGMYVQEKLVEEGMQVSCSTTIDRLDVESGEIHVHTTDGGTVGCDRLVVATGRQPNLDGLDLAAAGVMTGDRGWIEVNPETLEAADGIYAVGDVNGLGGFTHLSHYHGTVVGRRLRGEAVRANHRAVPRVTFSDPEVGSVGLSEKVARYQGINVRVQTAEVADSARGSIHGEPGGPIKIVVDNDRNVVVGATFVGPRSGELLTELTLAMRAEIPVPILADTLHAFPTFARILQGVFDRLNRESA